MIYYLLDGQVVHLLQGSDNRVVVQYVLAPVAALVLHKLGMGLYDLAQQPKIVLPQRARFPREAFALRDIER